MASKYEDEDPNYPRLPRTITPEGTLAPSTEPPIEIAVGRNWNEVRDSDRLGYLYENTV